MKRQRLNLIRNLKKVRVLPLKLLILSIVILLMIFFTLGEIGKTLNTSSIFKIKEIISKDNKADLSYLKGENIFKIDLPKESREILESYSHYQKIRLIRILPNRLFVDFIRRRPVACIKLYRYFYVDEERVLFDVDSELENSQLPLILGLETKIFGPKSGRQYNLKELALPLDIIKESKRNRILKDYKIKEIDVANLDNTSLSIEGLKIIIGKNDIKPRIDILANLLTQLKKDLVNIRYIDLRFKEPVIKFKNVE